MRFATYLKDGSPVVGAVDDDDKSVRALHRRSDGRPVRDLADVIAGWPAAAEELSPDGDPEALDLVRLLPPLRTGRNIICVGRNYRDHATEFSQSGFDASDPAASAGDTAPPVPVIFTKAAGCLIAHGEPIDPHPEVTSSLDYEGELAVIIGTGGSDIPAGEAWRHVWGYTLLNDVTARDRQRDHRQWFLGKSLDTFGPLGPFAVTADEVEVDRLRLTTRVNGEVRQDTSLADLIFGIPELIATVSAGTTLRPGDIIATGTPAGVGIGFTPPRYLRPGDEVAITAPRLGTLVNRVASGTATGPAPSPASTATAPAGLRRVAGRNLFVEVAGEGPAVVFVHGLGGTTNFYQLPAQALAEDHTAVRFDLSGHGRSPLHGVPTIAGWADDLEALLDELGLESAAVVGHSMGTLIAAHFAATRPRRTTRLALIGPVREQPAAAKQATRDRARTVREGGMRAVADTIVGAATSEETRRSRPLAAALVRELLLAQPPEGYARACEALAAATTPDFGAITAPALLLAGSDDKVSPPAVSEEIAGALGGARVTVLDGVGHWHAVEAPGAVTDALRAFL